MQQIELKKINIAMTLYQNDLEGSYEKEILNRYIGNYEKIENKIYPIDEYEYASEDDKVQLYNLDLCLKLIEDEDFNVEGWILGAIYGNSMFVFINRERKQAFDLIIDDLNEATPCYLDDTTRIIDAKSITDAAKNYNYIYVD